MSAAGTGLINPGRTNLMSSAVPALNITGDMLKIKSGLDIDRGDISETIMVGTGVVQIQYLGTDIRLTVQIAKTHPKASAWLRQYGTNSQLGVVTLVGDTSSIDDLKIDGANIITASEHSAAGGSAIVTVVIQGGMAVNTKSVGAK
jgi:hypothetical protein